MLQLFLNVRKQLLGVQIFSPSRLLQVFVCLFFSICLCESGPNKFMTGGAPFCNNCDSQERRCLPEPTNPFLQKSIPCMCCCCFCLSFTTWLSFSVT